jgi:hypothetical protein
MLPYQKDPTKANVLFIQDLQHSGCFAETMVLGETLRKRDQNDTLYVLVPCQAQYPSLARCALHSLLSQYISPSRIVMLKDGDDRPTTSAKYPFFFNFHEGKVRFRTPSESVGTNADGRQQLLVRQYNPRNARFATKTYDKQTHEAGILIKTSEITSSIAGFDSKIVTPNMADAFAFLSDLYGVRLEPGVEIKDYESQLQSSITKWKQWSIQNHNTFSKDQVKQGTSVAKEKPDIGEFINPKRAFLAAMLWGNASLSGTVLIHNIFTSQEDDEDDEDDDEDEA